MAEPALKHIRNWFSSKSTGALWLLPPIRSSLYGDKHHYKGGDFTLILLELGL